MSMAQTTYMFPTARHKPYKPVTKLVGNMELDCTATRYPQLTTYENNSLLVCQLLINDSNSIGKINDFVQRNAENIADINIMVFFYRKQRLNCLGRKRRRNTGWKAKQRRDLLWIVE
jgi:hypothetical protein